MDKLAAKIRIAHRGTRELLSELLGTYILTLFSVAAGAQLTLSRGSFSDFPSLNIANGLGVACAIYVSAGTSGGAVNPAVTLAWCLEGRLSWRRLPFHVVGQVVGAFIAAATVFLVYHEGLDSYIDTHAGGERLVRPGTTEDTAGIFCFFPQDYLSVGGGLIDSIVGTMALIFVIHGCLDTRGINAGTLSPLVVGLSVVAIGATFGMNCGYPINSARDLGPRLFILAAGWGTEAFSFRDYSWFWVPLVGPLVGSVLATLFYWLLVRAHWPDELDILREVKDSNVQISGDHDNHAFVSDEKDSDTKF